MLASLTDLHLEMVAFVLTGLSPKTQLSELVVQTRGQLCLGIAEVLWGDGWVLVEPPVSQMHLYIFYLYIYILDLFFIGFFIYSLHITTTMPGFPSEIGRVFFQL